MLDIIFKLYHFLEIFSSFRTLLFPPHKSAILRIPRVGYQHTLPRISCRTHWGYGRFKAMAHFSGPKIRGPLHRCLWSGPKPFSQPRFAPRFAHREKFKFRASPRILFFPRVRPIYSARPRKFDIEAWPHYFEPRIAEHLPHRVFCHSPWVRKF